MRRLTQIDVHDGFYAVHASLICVYRCYSQSLALVSKRFRPEEQA